MKVALYYPWVYLTSGAERTILELTSNSRHEWTIFTNHFDLEATFPGFVDRDVRELARVPVKRTVGSAVLGAFRIVSQRLPLDQYDALVVVCEGFGDLVVFRNRSTPALNLCLTPLRLSFDDTYRGYSLEARGALGKIVISVGARLFKYIDRMAWRRYRRIICISQEVKQRAVRGGLAKAQNIEVAHVGLGFEPGRPSDCFEPFFLIAGRIMWTKKIELGLHAFLKARKESAAVGRFRLVVAGMVDKKSESYLAWLRNEAGDAVDSIEFKTRVSDEELSELYRTCYATVFTAFNEDWGIVPLESMAFGKPVISTDSGGPKEYIVDGRNGFLVPRDADAFAARMCQLAENPELCRTMGLAGVETARGFSWQSFANSIDAAVDELAERAPSTAREPASVKGKTFGSAI